MAEISRTDDKGLTLGDLYDLVADATLLGMSRSAKVYVRSKPEVRFDRPPTALHLLLVGERDDLAAERDRAADDLARAIDDAPVLCACGHAQVDHAQPSHLFTCGCTTFEETAQHG